jgi:hypothetical protein
MSSVKFDEVVDLAAHSVRRRDLVHRALDVVTGRRRRVEKYDTV